MRTIIRSIYPALALWLCAILLIPPSLVGVFDPPEARAFIFDEFSVEDEKELGEKFYTLVRSRLPIIEDPEITSYVKGVVDRVAASVPPMPFKITTTVVRDSSINAFAAPAGYVFVFTGLIHNFDSEDELAGVIAHELAHVSQRHIASRFKKAQIAGMATMLGSLAGMLLASTGSGNTEAAGKALIIGSQAGGQSAMLHYSRQDEKESDEVGMKYLIDSGYPPRGMVGAFEKIRRATWVSGGSIAPYLSTHPAVEQRISYLSDRIGLMPQEIVNRETDNDRFIRIQTLVRARYMDPSLTLPYFESGKGPECMNAMGLGILYDRLNRVTKAEQAFDIALECSPDDSLVLREAGRFRFQKGDLDKAAVLLQRATFKNPSDLMALFFYARLLEEKKQYREAEEFYKRVLNKIPEDGEVHYHLGRMLGQAGDLFGAHLHLAYAGIYDLDKKQASFHLQKARGLAHTPDQKNKFQELEKVHGNRSEYW